MNSIRKLTKSFFNAKEQLLPDYVSYAVVTGEGESLSHNVLINFVRLLQHSPQKIIHFSSPLFEKIGSLKLTLRDVANAVKSHDLHQTNQHRLSLPVYESITCRLVAQPRCVTNVCLLGFLHYQVTIRYRVLLDVHHKQSHVLI